MSGSQQHHQQQSPNNYYRASYSPTEQHRPPHYQSSAIPPHNPYRPPTNGAVPSHQPPPPPPPPPPPQPHQAPYVAPAAPAAAPVPPSRSAYYDPVDRQPEISSAWGYPGRERTSSVHSQHSARDHRFGYGPESAVNTAGPQSPTELQQPPPFPYQSPTLNIDRRSSSVHGDLRVGEATPMHAEFRANPNSYAAAPGEATSPNRPAQNRRPGAMSISALLTNAEESPQENHPLPPQPVAAAAPPATLQSQSTRVSPTMKRFAPPEKSIQRSMDLNRLNTQQPVARPVVVAKTEQPAWDADVTDSDTEPGLMPPNGRIGSKQANHAFKYHESMKLQQQQLDLDRSDSSVASDEFETERINYITRTRKRQIQIEQTEAESRKRRRVAYSNALHTQLCAYGTIGRTRARDAFFDEAREQVLKKEEEEEKERKKEQQRKRRREKALVEKKIREETAQLNAAKQPSFTGTPMKAPERPPPFEEGLLDLNADAPDSDFSGVPNEEETTKKVRKKPGPKKGTARPPPKELPEDAMDIVKAEVVKEEYVPHASKTYNQLFDQIWKDIARKEIPKLYRIQQASLTTKHANLRKTAQLASKEAQRWKLRTTKNVKDTQARAKRCMREMLTFWKRNEREERDLRRRAEKEAIDRAKREEEQREAKRQARKLNFLISQTELYSHFIGRKIKTDEVEKSTGSDGIGSSAEIPQGGNLPELPTADGKAAAVTDFESLDFDDEEALQRAAASNAQHAIEAARKKAQAFNQPNPEGGEASNTNISNINLDDGDMNFQNPTSLGDIDIQQPKMLNCQLKEYQLKGLNWLCNLYEQGINGILADEMGLGKTVQSISVMAYLAEYHNIWGPFLVIAPASTLHNWQQEISRFVPDLKALPYWGTAKDRKVLRKFWDRKSLTYTKDSPFHVLITSYQLVVQDTQYFQRMKWQYMILDEAQAIKSSTSSRWKALLGFHCRNRLLLTGTPIQNSMQELWALLHFIMPSLFDSHDEFSEWFSKDIESHAQSNTQLNESQLRRLHMILKPFMLRRVKKHVQKELGDKIEIDVFCNLTYRQRAIYKGLRDKISIMDLIEKAATGGDDNNATLMNLVMQFRKVCNHPDLFERADVRSPLSLTSWGETSSFLREGNPVDVQYTSRNLISYNVPVLVYREGGRLDLPGKDSQAGSRYHVLRNMLNIWTADNIKASIDKNTNSAFSWLPFAGVSPQECSTIFNKDIIERFKLISNGKRNGSLSVVYDEEQPWTPLRKMLLVRQDEARKELTSVAEGHLGSLLNISRQYFSDQTLDSMDPMVFHTVSAPPIGLNCLNMGAVIEQDNLLFNPKVRQYIYGPGPLIDSYVLENKIEPANYPTMRTLPEPSGSRTSYSSIQVPSMSRFVSDSGKLAKLDQLLTELKPQGHRVLLYFQMTRMMDLCEEYLTYRHHKYLRLDGSSKLEDRRDMVSAWQGNPEIFVFILSTRAGGLGINLTAADTVIFYDSDWNPTIDSQAMDRAHRLGQTRQVSVYRLITRGTIEERIRMRAQQKEEVQRVVIQGGDPNAKKSVDFKGTREVATWLFDDDDAEKLEKTLEAKEKEVEEQKLKKGNNNKGKKRKLDAPNGNGGKSMNIEDMYHEGEGRFDDSAKPSDGGTPAPSHHKKKAAKGKGNKKKTTQERLNMIDGTMDVNMGGM